MSFGTLTTKSAFLQSPWKFELRDVEIAGAPGPGEALIRVEACGICGTDLSLAAANTMEWQAFGHEVAGVIQAIAPGEHGLNPGDRVALESSSYCGHCELCRNGRVDLCNAGPNFWGRPVLGFSERMMVPTRCLVHAGSLPAEIACLAEPAGVAYDMTKTAEIEPGDEVCLIGPGPIALMAIPLILRSGAARVVCLGRSGSRRRLEVARALGAELALCDGGIDSLQELKGHFDRVLVTAPVDQIVPALELLSYGGILTYIGIGSGGGMVTFDANRFHFRKLQLRASFASPALYYPAVLKLLESGVIPAKLIVSHSFGLSEIATAMSVAKNDKANAVKVIVKP